MKKNEKLKKKKKRLFIRFVSREAIPNGGDIADGTKFFLDSEHREEVLDRAWENFNMAIFAIRSASDNAFGDDVEAIAAAILKACQDKEEKQ